ncbi:barstar family protein [Streptomyces platensis]
MEAARIEGTRPRSRTYPANRDTDIRAGWQADQNAGRLLASHRRGDQRSGGYFGRNLDALADCLSGVFGAPDDDDYVVEWRDHQVSREHLGYPETARQLRIRLSRRHPTNRPSVGTDLAAAREERGTTVFDWLVEIFDDRAPGVLRLR